MTAGTDASLEAEIARARRIIGEQIEELMEMLARFAEADDVTVNPAVMELVLSLARSRCQYILSELKVALLCRQGLNLLALEADHDHS